MEGLRKVTDAEVTEVAGQRKLLKWTVPGLAHFFTMWGFTVLLTTIIEAYGSLFDRNFHIPWIGHGQLARLRRGLLCDGGARVVVRLRHYSHKERTRQEAARESLLRQPHRCRVGGARDDRRW